MKQHLKKAAFLTVLAVITTFVNAQTVTVDNYYNQETKKDKEGNIVSFHYLWEDEDQTGFSILGDAFKKNGAKALTTIVTAPSTGNLAASDVFIIVDPDNLKDNPKPNYMNATDANVIANWVKAGGVLFLLGNDQLNCDLEHFNILTSKFGFNFSKDLIVHVTDDEHFDDGAIKTAGNPVFPTAKTIFAKDASSITINRTAKPILTTKDGKNIMVSVKYGKGTVLAIGDPWLYNEYVNGRLPAKFENDKAANDIAKWLLANARKR